MSASKRACCMEWQREQEEVTNFLSDRQEILEKQGTETPKN